MRVSDRELKALTALYSTWYRGEAWCLYFKTIAEQSGLEPHTVRRTVRSLARKGLAEYQRGLFTDDGMIAGSGYACTKAGADLIESLNKDTDA